MRAKEKERSIAVPSSFAQTDATKELNTGVDEVRKWRCRRLRHAEKITQRTQRQENIPKRGKKKNDARQICWLVICWARDRRIMCCHYPFTASGGDDSCRCDQTLAVSLSFTRRPHACDRDTLNLFCRVFFFPSRFTFVLLSIIIRQIQIGLAAN